MKIAANTKKVKTKCTAPPLRLQNKQDDKSVNKHTFSLYSASKAHV